MSSLFSSASTRAPAFLSIAARSSTIFLVSLQQHQSTRGMSSATAPGASSSSSSSTSSSSSLLSRVYGLPPGPFRVGVTTTQFTDPNRKDPGDVTRCRSLQTEIWYPADAVSCVNAKVNKYSEFLGLPNNKNGDGDGDGYYEKGIEIANGEKVFGGYRAGLTIQELDDPNRTTWINQAVRDAKPYTTTTTNENNEPPPPLFPLVVFSHGSGAYRASYIYWCEFLASHGYVVAAPDHPGSARFTIVDGQIIVPGGPRSDRASMEQERPYDILTVMDGMEQLVRTDSRFRNLGIDTNCVGVTGMSFGGYTTAAVLETKDPRIKAAVLQCPSIAMSGSRKLHTSERNNKETPVMVMIGSQDTVIGDAGNQASRDYVDNHCDGPSYLLEIVRGGHVTFTSCDLYDPDYGNGIGSTKECPSLTNPGHTYMPLDIVQQHAMINSYGLAFLNGYLKKKKNGVDGIGYLQNNHFAKDGELLYRPGK